MSEQNDDLQKLVVLNNNVVMQLVQFVGFLQAAQAGTVDALDYLTHGDKEQAADLLSQAKGEMAGDLAEAGEGLTQIPQVNCQKVHDHRPRKVIIFDIGRNFSPPLGNQEGSVYNDRY